MQQPWAFPDELRFISALVVKTLCDLASAWPFLSLCFVSLPM